MTRPERERLLQIEVEVLSPPSLIENTLTLCEVRTIADLLSLDMSRVSTMRGVGRGKVEALDAGAQDYVVKPFEPEELLARMRVAMSEMVVEGILTNIPLHRELMVDASFVAGGTNIHYLEEWLSKRVR